MDIALFFSQAKATSVARALVGKGGVTGFRVRRSFRCGQFLGFTITLQKGVMDVPFKEV